jgi:GTPase SAR1 family protein
MGKQKKIIFAGLDNGGKSSIILTLQKKFSFLGNLRPTIGLSRTNLQEMKCLGMDLLAWDFGGQKKFRESYMSQRFHVFANVTTMFYVIDIQDKQARFDESLEYLKDIFETFSILKDNPLIIICFNKYDPDVTNKNDLDGRIAELQALINEINQNFDINYFNTSIFDHASLIKAFSVGIVKGNPKAKLISEFLREYAKITFSSGVILMDENSLIMGSHYANKRYLEIIEAVSPRFITAIERLGDYNLFPENVIVNIKFNEKAEEAKDEGEKEAIIFLRSFKTANNIQFTLVTLSRNKNTFKLADEYLPQLAKQLSEFMLTLDQ